MAGRGLYAPGATLRTGYTHFFKRRAGADRAAAHKLWGESSSGVRPPPTLPPARPARSAPDGSGDG